ncbi:hypothetical protein TIFTF001_026070 [Ficus carica]|uniref:non-specific serine/threonine protein kinase n=1 Tax=Ficus carica TaxID=3494 RepID=A0AA88APQ7_FICCA|nr:hypothetical protein TIFTF001_026070 [Ficus carica]
MFSKPSVTTLLLLALATVALAGNDLGFTYTGFKSANLSLDGAAETTSKGLLRLTKDTKQRKGHAFYTNPVNFKNKLNSTNASFSFSTNFVFAIRSEYKTLSGQFAFVIAPTRGLPGALPSQYLGLFNSTSNGNTTNQVIAIEFDTIKSSEFGDMDDNHVGIDINGLESVGSATARYYAANTEFLNLLLISGESMQVWIEYDGVNKQINVTMAPINMSSKPHVPLLSMNLDLSQILNPTMYVGFSSSTGSVRTSHYILGWSFQINGPAQDLIRSPLPVLPRLGPKKISKLLTIGVPLISVSSVTLAIFVIISIIRRKRKFAELLEDWELDYGPQRYRYKDLYTATKGFGDKELLGAGGFGTVYRGVLSATKVEIAVKKISHNSRQGVREFVAEIVSMGRLRHRNLAPVLGYCRRKGELLLVYDYMPNGSLDKYLYDEPETTLNWNQRFRVIKGVASGLFYLHEEWDQVVVHRDVKASNVLDGEFNGRLGDFGLARLYDHGTDPQTTHIVGTLGYLAPEHTRTGKATTSTDVFAFGAFLLEVACGRRPIDNRASSENVILVDRVFTCWNKGRILEARDQKLGVDFVAEEVELVLKLGLLCSHSEPSVRPSMRQVVEYLERHVPLPDLTGLNLCSSGLMFASGDGLGNFPLFSQSSAVNYLCSHQSSVVESLLSGGR